MPRIILSEASQKGIQGVTKKKPKMGKTYKKLVKEADERIDKDYFRYAEAYKKASTYLAR